MLHRYCGSCRSPLHIDDGHSEWVSCLGKSHVYAMLTGSDFSHCENISLASLRSRRAFFSESDSAPRAVPFSSSQGPVRKKQRGRGSQCPAESKLSPHREVYSVLFPNLTSIPLLNLRSLMHFMLSPQSSWSYRSPVETRTQGSLSGPDFGKTNLGCKSWLSWRDLLSQANGKIWHSWPELWALLLWPTGANQLPRASVKHHFYLILTSQSYGPFKPHFRVQRSHLKIQSTTYSQVHILHFSFFLYNSLHLDVCQNIEDMSL